MKRTMIAAAVAVTATLLAGGAQAAVISLTADVNVTTTAWSPAGVTRTGDGSSTTPWLYTFTTSDGLVLGDHKIGTAGTPQKFYEFDLGGGPVTGDYDATAFYIDWSHIAGYTIGAGFKLSNAGTVSIGDILNPSGNASKASITVDGTGSFTARDIGLAVGDTSTSSGPQIRISNVNGGLTLRNLNASANAENGTQANGGHIDIYSITGNVNVTGSVDTHTGLLANSTKGYYGGDVQIHGVTGNVTVGDIDTTARHLTYNGRRAGYVAIGYYYTSHPTGGGGSTSIPPSGLTTDLIGGDIHLTGAIDLRQTKTGTTNDGWLLLGADGSILVDELNLANMAYAYLNPGADETAVVTNLVGFSAGSNLLRADAGDVIYYDPAQTTGLSGSYSLFALDGVSAGGTLMELVPEPATMAFLAVGGLTLAGGAVARRRRRG